MKKSKKIPLTLNKKLVAKLNQENIQGGRSSDCGVNSNGGGLGSCVICGSDNGCTSAEAFPNPCHFG